MKKHEKAWDLRMAARAADPDRYLASLFERDEEKQRALWALIAFNGEIARVRETVSEAQRGLIRLQWWRDTLTAIAAGQIPPGPPLVHDLAAAIARYGLPRAALEALICAREFDLEETAPGNLLGLENYADLTTTPLLALMAQVLTGEEPEDMTFLRYLGVAYALTGLLRAVPFHAAQRRCYLPEDLLVRAGLLPEDIYQTVIPRICEENSRGIQKGDRKMEGLRLYPAEKSGHDTEKINHMSDVAGEVVQLARAHLDHTKGTMPHPVFRAMAALTGLYLRQMERAGYDVFSPRLRRPPALRELRVALSVAVSSPRTGT